MDILEKLKYSVVKRSFIGPNPLPLSAYLLAPIALIHKVSLFKSIIPNSIGFIIISLLLISLISRSVSRKSSVKLTVSDRIILAFILTIRNFEILSSLTVLITFVSFKTIINGNLILISIFSSLFTLTDASCIPILIVSFVSLIINLTKKLISPKITYKTSILWFIKSILLTQFIPIFACISFISFDIFFRNTHSLNALDYTLEFQACLKNFDPRQGFATVHLPGDKSETDFYVMDRSIISLTNFKYHSFFKLDESVLSLPESVNFCEIHKVHTTEFTDEEPRFIKNGDIVKFKNLNDNKFLGCKIKDNKGKFKDVYIDNFKEKEEFWIVETDGYLCARKSQVRFKNIKTDNYLCARKVKKSGVLTSSYNAERRASLFYITENINHLHFKTHFKDPKARDTVNEFKKLSIFKRILEYISSIDLKFTTNCSKHRILKICESILLLVIIFSILLLFIIYVIKVKYNLKLDISDETYLSLLTLISFIVTVPVIGIKLPSIEIIGIIFTKSLLTDVFKGLTTFNYQKCKPFKVKL